MLPGEEQNNPVSSGCSSTEGRQPAKSLTRSARMRLERTTITGILVVLVWAVPAVAISQDFKIVVNQANPSEAISKQRLEDLFLKKTGTWGDGSPVIPVDQSASSSTRQEFTKVVFDREVTSIKSHWQRQIFSGRGVPPPEKGSDDEVLDFVRVNRGAIGYVSSTADIGDGVKLLEITDQ